MGCCLYLSGTTVGSLAGKGWLGSKVYLSGTAGRPYVMTGGEPLARRVNLLESFMYVAPWQTAILGEFKSFMLDSGAFTFINGLKSMSHGEVDSYVSRYIDYINAHDIGLFYEMDIDCFVGYDKVLAYRRLIERGTGKRVIPVWHLERGKADFLAMCDEYDYVAVGGIATRDGRRKLEPYLPWFVQQAHKRGCLIHGLGYTNLRKLKTVGFDSVDSTAWLYGNRGGFVYTFDGACLGKVERKGMRVDSRQTARHNFLEWVRYAEHLEGE